MAQKKGQTLLADQFEGGVSTDKALLDIKRGIMNNLYHESIGMGNSATIKRVSMLDSITGTGIVPIDRIRNLTWKDYKPIAKGEGVIEPHTGNVDPIKNNLFLEFSYLANEIEQWSIHGGTQLSLFIPHFNHR